MSIIVFSQIKSYRINDFKFWVEWYEKFIRCNKIVIVNDNSVFDLTTITNKYNNIIVLNLSDVKNKLKPVDDFLYKNHQVELYNYLIENYAELNDIILTPDDDEFWWYDYTRYNSIEEIYRILTNGVHFGLVIPWRIISNNILLDNRDDAFNFNDSFKYIIKDFNVGMTKIIFTNIGEKIYCHHFGRPDFKLCIQKSYFQNKLFYEIPNFPIRIYHYQLTTVNEYNNKMSFDINPEFNINLRKRKRYYSKDTIKEYLEQNYKTDGWFDTLDLTVDETVKKFL